MHCKIFTKIISWTVSYVDFSEIRKLVYGDACFVCPQALSHVWGKRFAMFDGLECVKLADIGKIYYICIDIDQKYLPIIWVIFLLRNLQERMVFPKGLSGIGALLERWRALS